MDQKRIKPTLLKGIITPPPSKSMAHRALICAGLANGDSIIRNVEMSEDIAATCRVLSGLSVLINIKGSGNGRNNIYVTGNGNIDPIEKLLDCSESGSTLRFLMPVSRISSKTVEFTGSGLLIERPIDIYKDIFTDMDIDWQSNGDKLPVKLSGSLKPSSINIPGNISSQFVTGLLFALPVLDGDSTINITTPLESIGYVDLTLQMLTKAGINIVVSDDYRRFDIKGNQAYQPIEYNVEGDWSQAAFWIVSGLLGREMIIKGLDINSKQGDKTILDIVYNMGGTYKWQDDDLIISPSVTHGTVIDASGCPDLVPAAALLASLSIGETRIINAGRLRFKECDRLAVVTSELNKLGADIFELDDGLIINGVDKLTGGEVSGWNDHRIVMTLAIAAQSCDDDITISDSSAVRKSYPLFWEDYKAVGGNIK